MRLLILASSLPCPPDDGRRLRMYHLYGSLAQRHEIWWVCPNDGGDARSSARMFHRVRAVATPAPVPPAGQSKSRLASIARACSGDYFEQLHTKDMTGELTGLLGRDFDAVVVDSEAMAPYVRMSRPDVPWILNTQNVPSVVARRALRTAEGAKAKLRTWLGYRSALRFERKLFPRFFAVAVVSELERKLFVRRFRGIRVYTVPNGVDAALLLRPTSSAVDGHLLNFTGHFGYPPNRDAMRYFCTSIFPAAIQRDRTVRLELIGKGSREFAASLPSALPVSAMGYVDDVHAHIARASAVVAPFRVGGGTRIKILEAIALGTPVVSTSVGAEGLELDVSCGLLIADKAGDFVDLILRVLHDTLPRENASTAGRAHIARDYTWESAARRLENVLQGAIQGIDKQGRTR
jgi:glycosyltransferase involved in cell wall biosynthesis